jgi:hypothetical protein
MNVVLRYEKKLTEELVKQRLMASAGEITEALIKRASEGDTSAIKEAFDRMFGKVTQTIETPDHQPIVFMPAVLVEKFKLASPVKDESSQQQGIAYDTSDNTDEGTI